MPGRKFSTSNYRYGFNGKEKDREVNGVDGAYDDYGMRMYDARLGRFISADPLTSVYPELTSYQFASNTPIQAIDLDGLEAWFIHGTVSDNTRWKPMLVQGLMRFTNNTSPVQYFDWSHQVTDSWGDSYALNWAGNGVDSRTVAARELVQQILAYRKTNNITNEDITLIGHSHGGNVALIAARILCDEYKLKTNIITIETPAYNDASQQNPAFNHGLVTHWAVTNNKDIVQGGLAGSDTYSSYSPSTQNVELDVSDMYSSGVAAHSFDGEYPALFLQRMENKIKAMKDLAIPKLTPTNAIDHSFDKYFKNDSGNNKVKEICPAYDSERRSKSQRAPENG